MTSDIHHLDSNMPLIDWKAREATLKEELRPKVIRRGVEVVTALALAALAVAAAGFAVMMLLSPLTYPITLIVLSGGVSLLSALVAGKIFSFKKNQSPYVHTLIKEEKALVERIRNNPHLTWPEVKSDLEHFSKEEVYEIFFKNRMDVPVERFLESHGEEALRYLKREEEWTLRMVTQFIKVFDPSLPEHLKIYFNLIGNDLINTEFKNIVITTLNKIAQVNLIRDQWVTDIHEATEKKRKSLIDSLNKQRGVLIERTKFSHRRSSLQDPIHTAEREIALLEEHQHAIDTRAANKCKPHEERADRQTKTCIVEMRTLFEPLLNSP